jgi:predicted N-acyltransferase
VKHFKQHLWLQRASEDSALEPQCGWKGKQIELWWNSGTLTGLTD